MATMYPEKFENLAATISYSFSLKQMEAQFEQSLRVPLSMGVGADYAHDHLGYGVSPKDPGSIRIRTLAVESSAANLETEVAEAAAECYRIGKGYLYRLGTDGSTRRRCLARLRSMPSVTINGTFQFGTTPLIFDFVQLSDWMATTATTGTQKVDADDEAFTINNPGTLPCTAVVFRFRSDGAGPSTDLSLTNLTNEMSFSTTRDLTATDHELRVNTESFAVEWSTNDGGDYANDYSLFTIPTGQVQIMQLEPGDNSMVASVVSGTPDYTLGWEFYARYV
jgi:hypothetical protein